MTISFPDNFFFGTSASAYQTETACEHDWAGLRARDGHQFLRTTDHEKRYIEDADIIASLAPHYRMSFMWCKLQRAPYAAFEPAAVESYTIFLKSLQHRNIRIMVVMHHFANPTWFARNGGWENERNVGAWLNYGKQLVEHFGGYVHHWNTFNEPNLYAFMGYAAGEFPPFKKSLYAANAVLRNIAVAHNAMYEHIKSIAPEKLVGISHNAAVFEPENLWGKLPAKVFDWCYMVYAEERFPKTDFFGMSYYARIGFDPLPVTYLTSPRKFARSGKSHDDIWEYYPSGLEQCIMRYWDKYKKPIIITENGICTSDDAKRRLAIMDYLFHLSKAMSRGAQVIGYYHWSAWDNFEWTLGPTYNFGLYSCDPLTKERKRKESAELYARVAFTKEIEISGDRC